MYICIFIICIFFYIYLCVYIIYKEMKKRMKYIKKDNLPPDLFKMTHVRVNRIFSSSSHDFLFQLNKRESRYEKS